MNQDKNIISDDLSFLLFDLMSVFTMTKPSSLMKKSVAEFKEFERRFKFKPQFKYGWFHLKLYQMFHDLSRRLI